jgi:hypothetical protein
MIRALQATAIAVFVLLANASAASSQVGALLDWINKLSGPQFVGVGASFYTPVARQDDGEPYLFYRLDGMIHFSYDEAEEVEPDDASIQMFTLRNMLQFPVRYLPLDFGVGVALHRFSGTDFDAFWHVSYPIQAQVRAPLAPGVTLRFGSNVDVYPAFDGGDFLPLFVDVSRDRAEVAWGLLLGLDFDVF